MKRSPISARHTVGAAHDLAGPCSFNCSLRRRHHQDRHFVLPFRNIRDQRVVLKDTVLMLIADQNKKGGLLGRKLEPVVADPASDWDAFAERAGELLTQGKARWYSAVESRSPERRVFPSSSK